MPRKILRSPDFDANRSLGWLATSWMEFFVRHGPGDVQGQPVVHGEEYTGFIVNSYAVGTNPMNNHLLHDTIFLSRAKGCDKSGLAGRFCLFEAFGPCRFGGWAEGGEIYTDPWGFGFEYEYQPGEPIGRHITAPFIRILATEENQTGNTYRTVKFNLTDDDCPLSELPGIDVGKWSTFLPDGGEIRTSTASASSKDGGLETFAVADETHLYDTQELRDMRDTVVQNLWKRQQGAGTLLLETTTMFAPGDNSAAEQTFEEAEAIESGKKKHEGASRLYYDHRWGDCPDLSDEQSLRKAIRDAYGDAIAWMHEDSLVAKVYDTRTSPARVRRFMLNAQVPSVDSWIAPHEWDACGDATKRLQPGDVVVLGADGSIRDDSTAVVACRLDDGHMELIGVWEKPDGAAGEEWQVDREAVDACIAQAMRKFDVVGFYMDPPHWADYLDRWHNEFAEDMQVKATRNRPLEWWTNRPTQMVQALQRFHEAVLEQRITFTPPDDSVGEERARARTFRTHVINARRNPTRAGLQIRKEYPKSPKKVDACVAAVIAWECRNDAIAGGAGPSEPDFFLPKRIR